MLDLKFKKVVLHNFGSYSHAEIDLQSRGFCLVTGKNNCIKDNAESNGSGKSFIWSGICYALTGETINGLSKNLRNVNVEDTEMYVELTFNTDGNEYVIKRGQSGNPKTLSISKNGANISGKTFTETEQKVLDELPELTKDLIANTIIVGQGMPSKFSSFNPSGRKELLERLTKSDYMIEDIKTRVAGRLDELNRQIRAYDDSFLINNSQLNTAKTNLSSVDNQITSAVKPDYDKAISESEQKYNKIIKDRDVAKTELSKAETGLDLANKALLDATNIKAERITQLNEGYYASRATIATNKINTEARISSLTAEIKRLESIKDVCPTCGQKLVGVEKPSTDIQKAELAKLAEELEKTIKPALADKDVKYQEYLKQINEENAGAINTATTKVNEIKGVISNCKTNINDFDHYATVENENLIKLKYDKENWDNWFAGLKKQKFDLEAQLNSLENDIKLSETGKANLQEHLAVVKKMETLTKRDFRGYLLANIIAYIDQKAKDFSEIVFGTRELNIYIDGNNLDITYCGKYIDNLSGGEKTRVDLILQLAIRNMLQNYLNFNSNILVLDEITDFLDKKSCKAVMGLLERELVNIESVFIISHHAEELELPIDSDLKVVKNEAGISSIC